MKADYVGFTVPHEFVVGYGLDYKEQYRNLPYVGVVKTKRLLKLIKYRRHNCIGKFFYVTIYYGVYAVRRLGMNRIFRNTIFYLLIFLVVIGIVSYFNGSTQKRHQLATINSLLN